MILDDQEVRERVGRIESLLGEIESFQDQEARTKTAEMVQVLLELYGEGLSRILDVVSSRDEGLLDVLLGDELISHLLLLHGLHPTDLEARVLGALDEVRPYLESHGGNVQFLGIEGDVALVRLEGSCDGCPSSTMTLKLAIEEAIQKAAPELEGVEAEGVAEPPQQATIVAGPTLRRKKKKQQEQNGPSSWTVVDGLALSGGEMLAREVSGEPVLFLKLGDDLLSYRNICPGCGGSLEHGVLDGSALACPGCGNRYDVRRAGRALDASGPNLEPIPLLESEEGTVQVARPSAVG
jgi:Fe-S cluster biogenesis protein NfuA/nitrite reductase/ring-hydroxylating ferredoxin subunit